MTPASLSLNSLERKEVVVSGIRVRYVEAGRGAPVVLVHSLGASLYTWRDNIAALAERHRVYALDLPGHGDSDKPDIAYDKDFMLDLFADFVAALGHSRVALAGNSVGGGLCVLTALERPEIVSALVLASSGGLGREVAPFLRIASLPVLGYLLAASPMASVRGVLRKAFYDPRFAGGELLAEMERVSSLPGARSAILRIAREYIRLGGVRREYDFTERLGEIRIPTAIFWGADDRIIPVEHAHRAARFLPDCRLHVFQDCGHWPHMERAGDFNRLVLEFLSGVGDAEPDSPG